MDAKAIIVDLLVSLVSKTKPQALESIQPAFSPNLGEGYIDNSPEKLATQDDFSVGIKNQAMKALDTLAVPNASELEELEDWEKALIGNTSAIPPPLIPDDEDLEGYSEIAKDEFNSKNTANILTSKNKSGEDSHSFVLDLDCPHHFETDEQGNGYLVLDYKPTKKQLQALDVALKMMGLARDSNT